MSVLYDVPGPRARRRAGLISLVAGLLLLALAVLAVSRLADQGQLAGSLWSPLLNPGDENFAAVWRLLGTGFAHTIEAAAVAIVASLVLGTLLAVARMQLRGVPAYPVVFVLEVLRGLPVVIAIYFASRVLPEAGLDTSVIWYLVVGLVAYNMVIFAEILRAGVASLPRGQHEAALSIGLTRWQTMRIVLLPQAFRVMLPALISQIIVVLKDTSLAALILPGFAEALNQAKVVYQNLNNPIQTYVVVGVVFILVNYSLGRLAMFVQQRLARGSRATGAESAAEQEEQAVAT